MTLAVDELTVQFDSTVAVDRLSLNVTEGSIVAIVGPSGCGKSTLLRAVAGLVTPTAGTISWRGDDLAGVATEQRDVGLVFQDHALFTHFDVAANVAFGLRMRGASQAEQSARVDELLSLVGLDGFADRSVDSLSGGEAQRVALARALAPEPRLVLLDEPLAALDRARRDELNDHLDRVLRSVGQTALYVTHDLDEAFAVADQVGVMRAGRIERIDKPAELWRDPQTSFVAGFVGHGPIVEIDGQRHAVRADSTELVAPGDGYADGVVTGVQFRGDRSLVDVDVDGVSWRVFADDPPPLGASIGISVALDRLASLAG